MRNDITEDRIKEWENKCLDENEMKPIKNYRYVKWTKYRSLRNELNEKLNWQMEN
jgi:hypothetical protein